MAYKWKQLSRWDTPKPEYYTRTKQVTDGIASAVFLLVDETDPNGDGYIRSNPVQRDKVTSEMLELAWTHNVLAQRVLP